MAKTPIRQAMEERLIDRFHMMMPVTTTRRELEALATAAVDVMIDAADTPTQYAAARQLPDYLWASGYMLRACIGFESYCRNRERPDQMVPDPALAQVRLDTQIALKVAGYQP